MKWKLPVVVSVSVSVSDSDSDSDSESESESESSQVEGLGASLLQGQDLAVREELLHGRVEKLHRREARAIRT